jgi:hypothetical protein
MLTLADIVKDLGFVLAIDHCARGCGHCPAFGDRTPVQRAPLAQLAHTVATVAAARRQLSLGTPDRVVHCWRISDPLDYLHRQPNGAVATCADVAALWRTHLGQGLYVVTNGSEGSPTARRALTELVATPDLVSQVKLTITHADRSFGTPRYVPDLAHDVAQLAPLWRLPSTRGEDLTGLRFRINVKATAARTDEMRECVLNVLTAAGLTRSRARELCADRQRIQFKPIYDLGNATGAPSPVTGAIDVRDPDGARYKPTTETRERTQFGIRPDGRLFAVDMYAFAETDLTEGDEPATWPAKLDAADLHAPLGVFAHV